MNTNIVNEYSGKILGVCNYAKGIDYTVSDFLDLDKLSHIIAETYSSESTINMDGMMFLKQYYGLRQLAKLLEQNGGVESDLATEKVIYGWLHELDMMNSR